MGGSSAGTRSVRVRRASGCRRIRFGRIELSRIQIENLARHDETERAEGFGRIRLQDWDATRDKTARGKPGSGTARETDTPAQYPGIAAVGRADISETRKWAQARPATASLRTASINGRKARSV